MRQHLADVAARILVEEGASSFHAAKLKAAERLGITDTRSLPSNEEVETAVHLYQSLFHADRHAAALRKLRTAALAAMEFFADFSPRLVGSVLSGTAQGHSDVNLHLFSDNAEQVEWFLMERKIPFERTIKRYVVANGQNVSYPGLRFVATDVPIEVAIFPTDGLRAAPRSSSNGEPIKRANMKAVAALIDDGNSADPPR